MQRKKFFKFKPKKTKTEEIPKDQYIIYTDGSAKPNPGPGGYAYVAIYQEVSVKGSKGYHLTTNNRMEIMGVIAALEEFGPNKHFVICVDSEYVIKGATLWLKGWIRNNWVTASTGEPVKNADLWKIMDELLSVNKVKFYKVAAHTGDPLNEICDMNAKQAADNPDTVDEGYLASVK